MMKETYYINSFIIPSKSNNQVSSLLRMSKEFFLWVVEQLCKTSFTISTKLVIK